MRRLMWAVASVLVATLSSGCGSDSPGPSEPTSPDQVNLDIVVTWERASEPEFVPEDWRLVGNYSVVNPPSPGKNWVVEIATGTIPSGGVFRVTGMMDCPWALHTILHVRGRYTGSPVDSPSCWETSMLSAIRCTADAQTINIGAYNLHDGCAAPPVGADSRP